MEEKCTQNFFISIVVIVLYPLIPILVELVAKKNCLDTTLTLTAAVYSITVLTSSNKPLSVIIAIFPGMIFAILYVSLLTTYMPQIAPSNDKLKVITTESHSLITTESHSWKVIIMTSISMLAIGVIHGVERYKRHIMDAEPFLPFYK